jgi:Excalibur calcium-binding domain
MGQRYPNFRRAQREGGPYRKGRSRKRRSFSKEVLTTSLLVGGVTWTAAPQIQSIWSVTTKTPEQITAVESSVYYSRCDEARAAGAAPIYRGQPGYREEMDGDSDGVACEPYRGR